MINKGKKKKKRHYLIQKKKKKKNPLKDIETIASLRYMWKKRKRKRYNRKKEKIEIATSNRNTTNSTWLRQEVFKNPDGETVHIENILGGMWRQWLSVNNM